KKAAIDDLGESLLIEGVVERLAHPQVVKRFLQLVHAEVIDEDARQVLDLAALFAFHRGDLLWRHRVDELRLAREQRSDARAVYRDLAQRDGVYIRPTGPPISFVLCYLEELARTPFDEFVWTGADRVPADLLAVLFEGRRAQDRRRGVRQHVDHRSKRFGQRHP